MIIVTGSEGFLGKRLCRRLNDAGETLTRVDTHRCQSIQEYVLAASSHFRDKGITYIIHLAAHTQVGWCWENPAEAIDNNVGATLAAMKLAKHHDCHIIISTSDKVYPGGKSNHVEYNGLKGYCPYSQSKVLCDEAARAYNRFAHKNKVQVVRFGNLIGHDDHNEARLFPAIRRAVVDGVPLPFLHRTFRRSWLDVEDAVDGIIAMMNYEGHLLLNMAGDVHSVGQVVTEFERQLNRPLPFEAQPSQFYELPDLLVNSDLAKATLGWKPQRTLADTVAECLQEWRKK